MYAFSTKALSSNSRLRGFTLIELLACMGVIGILISLLLPAIQMARESARRATCANNMRQIGIALHQYETSIGSFPPDFTLSIQFYNEKGYAYALNISPHTMLLPQLDQSNLYNQINFSFPTIMLHDLAATGANVTVAKQTLGVFVCPSDGDTDAKPYGVTNYRANAGLCGHCSTAHPRITDDQSGAFTHTGSRSAEFADGLSQTIAFSEKLVGSLGDFTPRRDYLSAPDHDRVLRWSEWLDLCSNVCVGNRYRNAAGRTWFIGGPEYTAFFVAAPPNTHIPDCSSLNSGIFAARSHHLEGVNGLLADGSVRFIKNQIDPDTWRALGTRRGGELINQQD